MYVPLNDPSQDLAIVFDFPISVNTISVKRRAMHVSAGEPVGAQTEPMNEPPRALKGRGAASNPEGRFESIRHHVEDDGWQHAMLDETLPRPRTEVTEERARSVISHNDSPDIHFSQALNPYRGCEHGCIYCYARPSHSYLNLSPGLDFETRLRAKSNLAEVLRLELGRKGYRPSHLAVGTATDCYQPIERELMLTRSVIEVLKETRHPFGLVTKS